MFDSLGKPWPIHECFKKWGRNLRRTRETGGALVVQISEGITARRPPENFSIEASVIDAAQRWREKRDDHPIEAKHAYKHSQPVSVIGILREKFVEADIFKELDINSAHAIAVAPLGILGKNSVGRVTLHVPQESSNALHSYTAWLPSKLIAHPANMCGVTVFAKLAPVSALNRETIWHAVQYEIIGAHA